MIPWSIAVVAGLLLATLTYGLRPAGATRATFSLRALAGALATALLLDAPLAPARPAPAWLALDLSESWLAAGDTLRWGESRRALQGALEAHAPDSLLLFGDSLRGAPLEVAALPALPRDRASRVGPLVDAAAAVGRPVVIITDGRLDDADRLARLPRGSEVVVVGRDSLRDAAVVALDAPAGALGGDTVEVRVLVRGAGGGATPSRLRVTFDGREVLGAPLTAHDAYEEREFRLSLPLPARDGGRVVRATLDAGDAVARNDTASATIVVSGAAQAVFASTAPDQDARYALAVLRGTRRGAVLGFWRVAPGQWRMDGTLRPVPESSVRDALARAPLAILHGDTAHFGPPTVLTRGALVLISPAAQGEDFYTSGAGDSPIASALSGIPWDSLPPLDVSAPAPGTAPGSEGSATSRGALRAILARRARRLDERAVVLLHESPRRVARVPASGLWRWKLRGGRAAEAFDAVWGSIFDWVGATGAATDGATDRALGAPGISAEGVPRRPSVASGPVGDGAPADLAPRARSAWWLAFLALLALCVEWLLRRRFGLR